MARGGDSVRGLGSELARLARSSGMLRLALGDGLEALARRGGHHELGFATVEASALERCERSGRWVQESRWLSRRLTELPAVRHAVARGEISYSMASVPAKGACAKDEEEWLAAAGTRTVRAMREVVKERAAEARREEAGQMSAVDAMDDEGRVTLTLTVDREDAWLFEAARMLVKQVAGGATEETVEALLAEGTTSLLADAERADVVPFDEAMDDDRAQRAWELELSRYREGAEVRCEARFDPRDDVKSDTVDLNWDGRAEEIDAVLCRVAGEWARARVRSGAARRGGCVSGYGGRMGGAGTRADGEASAGRSRCCGDAREARDRAGATPRGVTFLRYLCVVLIDAWRPRARSELAYAEVYARDGHRCTSPVCSRRDLTPHHVVFRSAGGDDRDENVTSLCVWCHLDGVHGGRLAVTAPADAMTWHIGRVRHTVVEGRRRRQMRRRGSDLRLPSSGDGLQFFLRRSPTGCV